MATGWAGDGAVQDQIDATVKDAIKRARSRLPSGPGLPNCEDCDAAIPEARRAALPGVSPARRPTTSRPALLATTAAAARTANCADAAPRIRKRPARGPGVRVLQAGQISSSASRGWRRG